MAAIDKTYTNKYKDYKDFYDWSKNKVFKCPNGQIFRPHDYLYDWIVESDFDGRSLPIMNTPCELDYFLIKECPLEFVQETMKDVYGEEDIIDIKNGTSDYDKFSKEGKYGKHCKVIQKPIPTLLTKYPFGCKRFWVDIDIPKEVKEKYDVYSVYYDEDDDIWLWEGELGHWNTSACHKCKSIKSVIRHIRKWKLPIGAIVNIKSRYVGMDWKFKVYK